jgi:predicted DNA-binding protein (UPF0251 family)/predicted Fe-Mo cluster-binding NifX family protein
LEQHGLFAAQTGRNRIILNVEEYEVLRLLDYEGLTQEECAARMGVGRTTVQALYAEARKKMVRFLVEGACLQIEGGSYRLAETGEKREKGEQLMKIAVTYENGQVFGHFGHTKQFKIYETEDGKVLSSEIIDTNGTGHGALAGFLKEHGVETLICGNIGGGARNALAEAGIRLFPGAAGDADAQVESFLAGALSYDPDAMCSHHGEGHVCGGHGHHEEGHHGGDCGGHGHHGCGGHHGEGHEGGGCNCH